MMWGAVSVVGALLAGMVTTSVGARILLGVFFFFFFPFLLSIQLGISVQDLNNLFTHIPSAQ